jgi:glycosyltransferase involved in cell wall biosynthesis
MGLQGKHIVVDGYNLIRAQGTGVKTYGLTLIRALHDLGARVSVLWGGRGSRIPIVREAALYDRPPKKRLRPSAWAILPSLVRNLAGIARRPLGHPPTRLVIPEHPSDDPAPLAHHYYSVPDVYTKAHWLYYLTGIPLKVRFPDAVDAWHATYPLPIHVRGTLRVTTVHDLIPLRLPWTTLDNRQLFYKTVRRALDRSDLVLAVSEHTKNDLVDVFRAPPERIHVTYEPCIFPVADLSAEERSSVMATYGLRPREYVLFVGAIEPKKNVGRLLLAWRAVDAKIPLVVVGGKGWLWKDELQSAAPLLESKRLHLLSYVPRDHLRHLYAGALCFVFPSLYEGFGLPPLEAMAHGCPVLTSNVSSLPEICGEAALYCDPYDLDDLADKMRRMLADDGLRRHLADRGRARAEDFSMEHYKRRLAEAYGKILR